LNNFGMDFSYGAVATPFSVIIPAINSGGVISNAGFMTLISSGAEDWYVALGWDKKKQLFRWIQY
jgi:hypothetical protein